MRLSYIFYLFYKKKSYLCTGKKVIKNFEPIDCIFTDLAFFV